MNTPNLEASSLSLLTSCTRRTPSIKRERRGVWQMTHHLRRRRPLLLLEQRAHGEVEAGRRRLAPAVHQPPEKQSRVSQFAYCNLLRMPFTFLPIGPPPPAKGAMCECGPVGGGGGPVMQKDLGRRRKLSKPPASSSSVEPQRRAAKKSTSASFTRVIISAG